MFDWRFNFQYFVDEGNGLYVKLLLQESNYVNFVYLMKGNQLIVIRCLTKRDPLKPFYELVTL